MSGKKICFVINNFVGTNLIGGGGRVTYRIIQKLSEHGYRVDIICSSSTAESYPGINKIIVIKRPYGKKPVEVEAFFSDVRMHAGQERYDAVISDNITPWADISFIQYHSEKHRLRLYGMTAAIRWFSKRSRIRKQREWARREPRRIITVSRALVNDYVRNLQISSEKFGVVYPGVDVDAASGRAVLNRPDRLFTFGLVATGFSTKGGYIFLRALKSLAHEGRQFRARIIYPEYAKRPGMRMLVKYYGLESYLEFLPYQKPITSFYASLDCLVLPSRHEAFGLVALEAMANRLPCIVSSAAGVSEIIQDGVNGFVFDMRGSAHRNLAEKMTFLVMNRKTASGIAERGFETAKRHSWDKTCMDFVAELEKAAGTAAEKGISA